METANLHVLSAGIKILKQENVKNAHICARHAQTLLKFARHVMISVSASIALALKGIIL
jgi:hypothetical protein